MFKKLSFKAKLISLSLFTSAVMILIGGISYVSSAQVEKDYQFVVEKTLPKTALVNEMVLHYRQMRIGITTLGLTDLPAKEAQYAVNDIQVETEKFEQADAQYVNLGFIDGQKERYEKVNSAWHDFKAVTKEILSLDKENTSEARRRMLTLFITECPQKAKVFRSAAEDLLDFHKTVLNEKIKSAKSNSQNINLLNWIFIAASVLTGFGISLFLSISSSNALKSIATGLIENASEVSGTVSDLAASAAALSDAAETQSSSIQETAASMEEIRTMVQRNSESTSESAQLSQRSKEFAVNGQSSVQTMISAVAEITDSNKMIQQEVESSNRRISEIVSIISEIETKTNVINDIVFQTKLLSFNASVEAARAGEHGKGFAVVAEEVGNLANMSGNAAKEISSLLLKSTERVNSIVQETTSNVKHLMDQSTQKLERGHQVAGDCRQVLEKIVTNTEELSRRVQSIASASQEQFAGVEEVGKAILLLEQSTHVNASETANTSASAQHLGTQAKSLNQSIYRLQALISGKSNTAGTIVNAFIWRDRYAIGVAEMDGEHKILIQKINSLVSAINNSEGLPSIKQFFADLAAYTTEHFSDEELYMRSIGYPQLADHKKIHHKLLEKVGEFGKRIEVGDFDAEALIAFLNDWLVKHILGVDVKYAQFSEGKKAA